MVGVSASVNLPLHHKVQRYSSGTGSPGWSLKKGRKTVVVVVVVVKPLRRYGDFSKMAAVRHLGFVMLMFGPPMKGISWSL